MSSRSFWGSIEAARCEILAPSSPPADPLPPCVPPSQYFFPIPPFTVFPPYSILHLNSSCTSLLTLFYTLYSLLHSLLSFTPKLFLHFPPSSLLHSLLSSALELFLYVPFYFFFLYTFHYCFNKIFLWYVSLVLQVLFFPISPFTTFTSLSIFLDPFCTLLITLLFLYTLTCYVTCLRIMVYIFSSPGLTFPVSPFCTFPLRPSLRSSFNSSYTLILTLFFFIFCVTVLFTYSLWYIPYILTQMVRLA